MTDLIPVVAFGNMFGWAQLETRALGRTMVGITKIEYKLTGDKAPVFGKGRRAIGTGYGNITASGSLTLFQEELQALRAIAPLGDITRIPAFDIIVRGTRNEGLQSFVHKLIACEFKDDGLAANQNDLSLAMEIPLLVGDIDFGGVVPH